MIQFAETPEQAPLDGDDLRALWRRTVGEVADQARQRHPQSASRLARAVKLVLAGDVRLQRDGTCDVASQSGATLTYHINGTGCLCRDAPKAPEELCAHRLAAGIYKRAQARMTQALEAQDAPGSTHDLEDDTQATPPPDNASERRLGGQSIPAQFIVELHGKQFILYAGLLQLAHASGLVSLKATLVTVTPDMAVAEATATFRDGRAFTEAADSTPENVNKMVRLHYPRMALTRAKARALRDALDIGMCAVEELEG